MRIVGRRAAMALAVAVVTMTQPVLAGDRQVEKENKSLDWLMKGPVTLLDLGIFRLREDLNGVARYFHERGFTALLPQAGVYYDWREKQVIAYLTIRETIGQPSHSACQQAFDRMTRKLTGNGPVGNNLAGWYLENIFAPEGPGNHFRPKTMSRDLLESVRFEISILPPNPLGNAAKAQCAGRLDADPNDLEYTIS